MTANTEIYATNSYGFANSLKSRDMKTRIILVAIVLTLAIWFVIGWAMEFIGWNDYHVISCVMIALIWHIAIEMMKIVKQDEGNS